MSHVINSRALTVEKPCINKAIHALLMHGYGTFNMIVPGPQICCHYEMRTARPLEEHSPWKLRSRYIGEKAKQNSTRNNEKCNKCFQFLCNNSPRPRFSTPPSDLANVNACKPCLILILNYSWKATIMKHIPPWGTKRRNFFLFPAPKKSVKGIMLYRPKFWVSVCPSVRYRFHHSYPLHNSDTVRDIFTKFHTNIHSFVSHYW